MLECIRRRPTRRGANQDGGTGRCPVPWGSVMAFCDGSGRAGGRCLEWIDWWFADEEAEDLAEFIWFQSHPFPGAVRLLVLLLNEGLLAVVLFLHHSRDLAAEVMHEFEQPVPARGGAEAGDDGEIAADLGDGAADRSAAHLEIELLLCGHEEFWIVVAWGQRQAWRGFAPGWLVRWWLGLGVRWCGLRFRRADAADHHLDVSAGCGAREQEALQRFGTQDAAVEVGEDGREVGGAEACRDGGECGGGGAAVDGVDEVAAVADQDIDGVEEGGDVLGHGRGFAGLILWRIGRRGGLGRVSFHVYNTNGLWERRQRLFSARGGWVRS